MKKTEIVISKEKMDVYKIRHKERCIWGDITVEFGKKSAQIMINSDYGSYAYNWFSTGNNPKEFLCELDMYYAMEKLSDYNLYEPDPDKYETDIKEKIIHARKMGYLSNYQARSAWEEMLGILDEYRDGELLFHSLIEHKYFNEVFGDFECLPSARRVKPKHEDFWKNVWIPFTEELKKEMKEEE